MRVCARVCACERGCVWTAGTDARAGFWACVVDFFIFLILFSGLGLLSLCGFDLGFCGVGWSVGWVCNVV